MSRASYIGGDDMLVKVKDFQSLADVEIELNGFITITGVNNVGESALRRAVYFAHYGKDGDFFIRTGTNRTEVEVKYNDDIHLKWIKERGKSQVGSLGAGNHFLEIQKVEEIYDEEAAKVYGVKQNQIVVMIHTGSRGCGHQICTDHLRVLENAVRI